MAVSWLSHSPFVQYDYERENPGYGFHSFGEFDFTGGGPRDPSQKVLTSRSNHN